MQFPYEEYCYVLNRGGRYQTLFGDPAKKVERRVSKSEKEDLREHWGRHEVVYESDVRPEMRVLIDYYQQSDDPSSNHRILWFDIEVSTDPEFPDPKVAQNEVTSVAVYDGSSDTKFVLLLDEEMDDFKYEDVIVRTFDRERDLLKAFLTAWRKINPTIVVGYNSDYFDIPYTYRRLKRVFGEEAANQLSPVGIVDYNERKERFYIAGVSSLDYLQLYKNFTFSELSSYSLDNVAREELDQGKVEYKGREYVPQPDGSHKHVSEVKGEPSGTKEVRDLDDLREYDPGRFVRYNMEDVMLLVDIDEKRDFIQLARKICHMGHVPYEDIYNSSRFIDGAALTRLSKRGIVAPDCKYYDLNIAETHPIGDDKIKTEGEIPDYVPYKGTLKVWKSSSTAEEVAYASREADRFVLEEDLDFNVTPEMDLTLHYKGAYVKEPNGPGMHQWVYDLDLTSMYPSIIMSINISPETKVGRVYGWNAEDVAKGKGDTEEYEVYLFDRDQLYEMPREQLVTMLREQGFSIASNGVFYRNDRRGIIPRILEEWYEERNRFKQMRNDWREKEGEDAEAKADYYDNMQHVHKILINSVYGVLGLPTFRFYDIDNAMAVTETGRSLIGFSEDMGNKYYNDELDMAKDWCVYTDTDSVIGETTVRTNKSQLPIAELFDREASRNRVLEKSGGRKFVFPDGLEARSTKTGNKARMDGVEYIEKHSTEKRLFRVCTSTGEAVTVTSDHSLMIRGKNGTLEEKKPTELEPGDCLLRITESS